MNYLHWVVAALLLATAGPFVFSQVKPDALAEYRQGNFERAVQICQEEITTDPGSLESYVVACWSLLRLGRYGEVLRFARTARTLSRYDARVAEILGEVYYYQGNNSEALQYFQEYVNLAPGGQRIESVYYFIGEIYIRMGKYRHADIALSTAVHWVPGNASWWTRLAFARENAGELTQAISAYEKALALNPQLPDARRGLDRTRQTLANR
ncbi:MAG: tetratricopeptide repeat protein [Treponema sp.]|jgi:tetratricopeptide (TPR) repeat protein|nr:tetratricopeptide repeat protein [Treponema sp.]